MSSNIQVLFCLQYLISLQINSTLTKEGKMQKGKVKFYNKERKFGFISGDDGIDYFFHETGLSDGTYVKDDDKVEFVAEDGDRGKKAVDISITD